MKNSIYINVIGKEGLFLSPKGEFGTGGGWADTGFISDLPVLLFANNQTEKAIYMFFGLLRARFDQTDPVVQFVVYSTNAPSGGAEDVHFRLTCRYIDENEGPGKADDQTLLKTLSLTNFTADVRQPLLEFTLNRTLINNGDVIHLILERIGGDDADNYGSDAAVGQSGIIIDVLPVNP